MILCSRYESKQKQMGRIYIRKIRYYVHSRNENNDRDEHRNVLMPSRVYKRIRIYVLCKQGERFFRCLIHEYNHPTNNWHFYSQLEEEMDYDLEPYYYVSD
ncbi:hypothetical protein AVEN_258392-1 [Araneus ventricosus]|uniref:Uncharacterized protein n=1 Tax=Araneus ventricosus TaxID=182803 RepID=A0A4Y1ZL49_ARAVE|nr:hypothetical protein AVEN_258392-1 [Araneus ventricosus]